MIYFLCDKKACADCGNSPDCMYTTRVEHAVNFKKIDEKDLWEQPAILEEKDSLTDLAKELNVLLDKYIQVRMIKFPYVDTFNEQRKQVEEVCKNIELAISSLTSILKNVAEAKE